MNKHEKTGTLNPPVETLTVYGADWCPDVRRSRKLLDAQGVHYIYIDLDHDKPADTLVRGLQGGKRRIPTLVWPDDTFLIEPSDDQLIEHLEGKSEAAGL